jgi:hypothetical protein
MMDMGRFCLKLLAIMAGASLVCAAVAQAADPPTVVIKLLKPTGAAGRHIKGEATVTFADGLHGYQNPPSENYMLPVVLKLDAKGFKLAKIVYPKGEMLAIGGETKPAAVYGGTIKIPFVLALPNKAGKYPVAFKLAFQQCNDVACFRPDELVVKTTVTVTKK